MFYKIVVAVLKVLVFLIFDLKVHNAENLNKTKGGYIVCGNHISMIDPVILAVSTKRQIHYMGKKELFDNKVLSFLFRNLGAFPVDRQGISLSAIKSSIGVLNEDGVLGIYPEGTRILSGYDENNAKPGIAMIANKANAKILPVFIKGPYKFRGRLEIFFGEEKDYFEKYEGKLRTEEYTQIGREILKDIYNLQADGKNNEN